MFRKMISVCLLAALICVMSACVQQPTPFEEPERPAFPTLPEVSIKENVEAEKPSLPREEKVFVVKSPTDGSYQKVLFGYVNGIVDEIYGEIYFEDRTNVVTDDLENDVKIFQDLVEEYDLPWMNVSIDRNETSFFEVCHFLELDENAASAELAAAFIGFEAEDGKITIEKASEAMLAFGFTEE